jgi:predicted dehydrogenase
MNLTPEQEIIGRRNFLKALAGTPALAALGAAAALKGPLPGGPVRLAYIGVGSQGRAQLDVARLPHADVRALCDINPSSLTRADEILKQNGLPPARHYAEWREVLQKEDIEGVVLAPPLWAHADIAVGCLEAGKHVLCEKMMAWDVAGCERMRDAARRTGRVLEIGYQRFYNPMYEATYDGIIRQGVLGDVYYARLAWHRNANWRRQGQPPSSDYDPSRWGYPTFEHLLNWRLYWKYSQGLFAELGSHQLNVANWFFGAEPDRVIASGGVYRFADGREVPDHVFGTFEYSGGRTATFTSVESNAFDDAYEMFMGTKGTLILKNENAAYLFEEGSPNRPTAVEVTTRGGGPAVQTSETVSGSTPDTSASSGAPASGSPSASSPGSAAALDRRVATRRQLERFCAAVRVQTPVACGPDRAIGSATACIRANESLAKKKHGSRREVQSAGSRAAVPDEAAVCVRHAA